jgi:hypothetical protein
VRSVIVSPDARAQKAIRSNVLDPARRADAAVAGREQAADSRGRARGVGGKPDGGRRCCLVGRGGLRAVVMVDPPSGDFAVLAHEVHMCPVGEGPHGLLAQVAVGTGQRQAGR